MARHLSDRRSENSIRRCVGCGFSVEAYGTYGSCQQCGCEFDLRPPRSYFEMEGLPPEVEAEAHTSSAFEDWREQRLVERWLWFIFSAGLLLSTLLLVAGS